MATAFKFDIAAQHSMRDLITYRGDLILEGCTPSGNGLCEGYNEDETYCVCACHSEGYFITNAEALEWHDNQWVNALEYADIRDEPSPIYRAQDRIDGFLMGSEVDEYLD